jgi:peptide/nickel transport system permease protein
MILRRIVLALLMLIAVNAITYVAALFIRTMWPVQFRPSEGDSLRPTIQSLAQSYASYLGGFAHGDFGSLTDTGRPIIQMIATALPKSLILIGLALLVSAVVGVGLGLFSLNSRTRQVNPLALITSLAGFSMPGFYLSIVVIYLIITSMQPGKALLPASGYGLDRHLVLPILALAIRPTAEVARLTAEFMAEELPKDYIRAARAKGLPWRLVLLRHAFRNILSLVLTSLSNSLRYTISSLIVIEWLFQWPGIGRLLASNFVRGPNRFVFPVEPALSAGIITVIAILFMLTTFAVDTATFSLDPRVRRQAAGL